MQVFKFKAVPVAMPPFAAILLTLMLTLIAWGPAHAGTWEFDGFKTIEGISEYNNIIKDDWAKRNPPSVGGILDYIGNSQMPPGAGYVRAKGTFSAKFKWVPNTNEMGVADANDLPPKMFYAFETSQCYVDLSAVPAGDYDITVSDALGDPEEDYWSAWEQQSQGSQVTAVTVPAAGADGTVEVILPSRSMETYLWVSKDYAHSAAAMCGCSYGVSALNYSISASPETSYYKAGDSILPAAHVNPPDIKVLDSAVHWEDIDGNHNYRWVGSPSYTASTDAFSPKYIWSQSGAGSIYVPVWVTFSDVPYCLLPPSTSSKNLYFDFGSEATVFPASNTIQAIMTDTMNAGNANVGPVKATVTWHLPVQDWHHNSLLDNSTPQTDDNISGWGPIGYPLKVTYSPENVSAYNTVQNLSGLSNLAGAAGGLITVFAPEEAIAAGMSDLLFTQMGMSLTTVAPATNDKLEDTDFATMWSGDSGAFNFNPADPTAIYPNVPRIIDAQNLSPGYTPVTPYTDDTLFKQHLIEVRCVKAYTQTNENWEGDGYGPNGYTGLVHGFKQYDSSPVWIWQCKVDLPSTSTPVPQPSPTPGPTS